MNTNGTFTFDIVATFEMDTDQAAEILANPFPNAALSAWMGCRNPCPLNLAEMFDNQRKHSHALNTLRTEFGKYLADKKVAERKQLSEIAV